MELKKAIIAATAVKINGSLAGSYKLFEGSGFTAGWSNGASTTYIDKQIDDAKYFNGYFIIDNDLVEFFTLQPLNPTYPIG